MGYTDLRLKARRAFKKYKKIVFIVISIWGVIIFVNYLLKNNKKLSPRTN